MFELLTKKISWRKGLLPAVILLSIWPLCSFIATRPLVNLETLSISAMGLYPIKKQVPICRIEWDKRVHHNVLQSISFFDKPPHAWNICFLYDKVQQNLYIHIIWIDPCCLFGQFDCYYEVSSPEVKADLLKFIEEHKEDLHNHDLQSALAYMLREHKAELTKIGNGDPYIGLERAGVADWIKTGKDPEVEWQKKYPSKNP